MVNHCSIVALHCILQVTYVLS